MYKENMEYLLFLDYAKSIVLTGAENGSNFNYLIEGLLPVEYDKYHVKLEYITITHVTGVNGLGGSTYLPFQANAYKVLISFNSCGNIYSSDNYVNVYTGITKKLNKQYYYDFDNNAAVFVNFLGEQSLEGKDGFSTIIQRPRQKTINIKIVNAYTGGELIDTANNKIGAVLMLLKFTPFIE